MPQQIFQPIEHTFNTADFAVVAALLDFYGLPYSARSLNDYLHHHSFGSLMTEIADCLLQHGLDTTLVNAQPNLFSRSVWNDLFLLDYPKTDPDRLPSVNEVERVVAKGVFLKRLLPSLAIIDEEMAANRPVVISYNPALINSLSTQGVTQGIIAPAEDDQHYVLFEPALENRISQPEKQVVLYAINQVVSPDPTANSIILSKVRTPTPTAPPGPLPEI